MQPGVEAGDSGADRPTPGNPRRRLAGKSAASREGPLRQARQFVVIVERGTGQAIWVSARRDLVPLTASSPGPALGLALARNPARRFCDWVLRQLACPLARAALRNGDRRLAALRLDRPGPVVGRSRGTGWILWTRRMRVHELTALHPNGDSKSPGTRI